MSTVYAMMLFMEASKPAWWSMHGQEWQPIVIPAATPTVFSEHRVGHLYPQIITRMTTGFLSSPHMRVYHYVE